MEFKAEFQLEGAEDAADAIRSLREELEDAAGALAVLQHAAPNASKAVAQAAMNAGSSDPAAEQAVAEAKKVAKTKPKTAKKEKPDKGTSSTDGAKMAAGAAFAAAGVGGAAALAQVALGYRGMAQLQALGYRTQIGFRGLFKGVDPGPAVRAADRFLRVFDAATLTGKTLSGVFTRSFNTLFTALEKVQPYATAAFEGALGAALGLENMYLRLRLALLPYTSALEEAGSKTSAMRAAAGIGAAGMISLGVAATVAAAPILAIGAAFASVTAAIEQATKLYREWDELMAARRKEQLAADGFVNVAYGIKIGEQKRRVRVGRDAQGRAIDLDEPFGPAPAGVAGPLGPAGATPGPAGAIPAGAAGAAGVVTGKAYADGLAKGVAAGTPGAAAAGGNAMDAIDKQARVRGDIHSPSKKGEKTGLAYPQGMARGVDAGGGDVQAAVDRSLAPKMPGAPGAAFTSASAQNGAVIQVTVIHQWPSGAVRSADVDAAAYGGTWRALNRIAGELGIAVEASP